VGGGGVKSSNRSISRSNSRGNIIPVTDSSGNNTPMKKNYQQQKQKQKPQQYMVISQIPATEREHNQQHNQKSQPKSTAKKHS
jgi:hypothetical protein